MTPIVIEQNQADVKLAFTVQQNANISRVRLANSRIDSELPIDGEGAIAVSFNFKSRVLTGGAPDTLRLRIDFSVIGQCETTSIGLRRIIRIDSGYEVDYSLRDGFQLTPAQAKAFKNGNAVFNVWPYFREYVQSTVERMGLPPLTAPFLRLQPKAMASNEPLAES